MSYSYIKDINKPNYTHHKMIKVPNTERNQELFNELGYKSKYSEGYLVLDYDSTLEILLVEMEIFYIKL